MDRTPVHPPGHTDTRLTPGAEREIRRLLAEYALRILLKRRQDHARLL